MMDGTTWPEWLLLGMTGLIGLLTLWVLTLTLQLRRLRRLLRRLSPQGSEKSLEDLLDRIISAQEENKAHIASLENRMGRVEILLQGCLQRVSLIRFDAFKDTAGQQSFALALLDGKGNGVVITSLFGRTESRCYAKPVVKGGSPYRLFGEEEEAIRKAMEQTLEVEVRR